MLRVEEGLTMPKNKDFYKDSAAEIQNWQFRDVITNLSHNAGAELLNYARSKEGVLSLAQGEGDQPTPDFIIEAAYKAMKDGQTFYSPVLGVPQLRQDIANYYSHHYDLSLPTNRIFVTGSGTTAMHLALTAVVNEGDEILAVTPIWKNLLGAVEIAQGRIKDVPLENYDGQWSLDLDRLFDSVSAQTKALIIVSPSNPTGWVLPKKDVKAVLDFAREHDLWIISDEVYTRTTFDAPRAPSFLDFAEEDDKLFVVNSFSKLWAMTGWRLGWLVGPSRAEDIIRNIAIYDNMGTSTFSQYGAMEALRHGEDHIAETRALWRESRDYVLKRFENHSRIKMLQSDATFYGLIHIDGEEDCIDLARRLINEARLSLSPGVAFGQNCKGYLRLCLGVSRAKLDEALDRLERFVQN